MEEVVKQLALATLQLQQSMVAQQASMVTQQQATEAQAAAHQQAIEALRETAEAQAATQQRAAEAQAAAQQQATEALREASEAQAKMLLEAVRQMAQGREAAGVAPSNQAIVRASHFLQKLTPTDDVEAFLKTFERTAEREGWSRDRWAGLLAPFLTGEPQKAYYDLTPTDALDYDRLKAEILARLGVTTAVRAQRVYSWKYLLDRPARSQMHDLVQLATKWLQPEVLTGPQMVERFVLDRFLRALPVNLQRWVSHGDPKTAEQLVEMVERYTAVEDLLSPKGQAGPTSSRVARFSSFGKGAAWNPGTNTSSNREGPPGATQGLPPVVAAPRRGGAIQCWRCSAWGHTRAQCPLQEEPMQCDVLRRVSYFAHDVCLAGCQENFVCTISVNQVPTKALLDSGSMVTMVHADLIKTKIISGLKPLKVVCIHGDTKTYPVVPVLMATDCGTITHAVGVVRNLMCKVILGRDFPLFWELLERVRGTSVRDVLAPTPSPIEIDGQGLKENMLLKNDNVLAQVDKRMFEHPVRDPEQVSEGGEDSPLQIMLGEDDEESSPQSMLPDLDVSKGTFITAQMRDPTLSHAREQVTVMNGGSQEPGADERFPHFSVHGDLLYRVSKVRDEVVEQLLVPQTFRRMVLDLAHNEALGGQLGAEKTEARIADRFYWPGLKADVKNFCASCPTCQLTAPMSRFRNPLVPLPIIEVPFERIAMDIVGPLVKSARGHQYILVVLDYATRYPEAFPLRKPTSKAIARELFNMFTRTGFPREILTDQGTPFMSKVMADLCKLFKIQQMRTSVYHPQTDGLVERFNKTLKMMLKRVVQKDGKDWDCLIPAVMFAVREVPQASTGFSPFELVYGRRPRGLLDLVKETWESESSPHISVVEHISQMQERIAKVMPLVKEHLMAAQEAQRRVYNRSAKVRQFQIGDRVAVLIPTVESKFLARWQGPFEIIEKIGDVNYKVHQPGKRKPFQLYHVNLLKLWKERETDPVMVGVSVVPQVSIESVKIAPTLSKPQVQQVKEFLQRNRGIFSDLPGLTHLIEHNIITEPRTKVFIKPYRIPEARRKAVSEEVKRMLELDIIEESQSDWSSPIVLVPKPNGTWWKLNDVSKFDGYPMPRVDELIERLGPARYISTLDLTKGYWQIPLAKEAREKTAFSTPEGHFQYKRMPFGLQTAPATFQRVMDRLLRPHQRYASVYLDDIVIFSSDWESHLLKVQAVLDALRKGGFTVNPEKCALGMEEAKYLGYIVGKGLVKPQVNKVEAIQEWPRPVSKKQVRAFLGIVGYYRRFIPNFSTLAAPLTDLTKGRKSVMIQWTGETDKAFMELKLALCQNPVLVAPDFTREFVVQTDASDVGLGAVLSQVIDGEEHPVVFLSRKLTAAEKNYAVVERECLAIKWALDSLRYYLLGRKFRLISDHAPLYWMKQNRGTNARVSRWFLSLQEFNFLVEHRPGKEHQNADALSRVHCMVGQSASTASSGLRQRGGICRGHQGWVLDGRYVSPLFGLWSL
ncbi:uncharacterized protein [Hyperolius riggenbachi]|uniref:uncharacterized protein n=1 Tax=Hyperolius riggenbachi TaxID=752182 RepID=UPI0035A2916F